MLQLNGEISAANASEDMKQNPHADALQDASGDGSRTGSFFVAGGVVQNGVPQAVLALQVTQRTNLCFVGVQNERLDPLIQRTLEHIQIVQNTQREPAVAAAPEHAAEVVHPIERPAVEEQAGVGNSASLRLLPHRRSRPLCHTFRAFRHKQDSTLVAEQTTIFSVYIFLRVNI